MFEQIIIAVVILSVIGSVISMYNSIVSDHKSVQQSWDDVTVIERQRMRILPELEKVLKEHKLFESEVFTKIAALRNSVEQLNGNDIEPSRCADVGNMSTELMNSLRFVSESYPELKASESFSKNMDEIVNQEEQVGAALRVFNQNVSIFNTRIESFPSNMVNGMLNRKKPVDSFVDNAASSSFDYKPNL
ncbi:LemA family protein [Shewanella youngdeokensis]|uniref:LemA family protein n=1 Tax=Shewanella youngdeokensis TaxID=2999068 RepID=A0ABZ0JX27_9GAMM|nr:LemA family protein [Shewanella sp. DAU334]